MSFSEAIATSCLNATGPQSSATTISDENATRLIPINAEETYQLNHLLKTSPTLALALNHTKNSLFSKVFDIVLNDKSIVMSHHHGPDTLNSSFSKKSRDNDDDDDDDEPIDDDLSPFGLQKKSRGRREKKKDSSESNDDEEDGPKSKRKKKTIKDDVVKDDNDDKPLNEFFKTHIVKKYWLPALRESIVRNFAFGFTPWFVVEKEFSKLKISKKTGKCKEVIYVHNVWMVPPIESGYVSTYVDSNYQQRLVWTWYPHAVPKNYDRWKTKEGHLTYTDESVHFMIKSMPTLHGRHTSDMSTVLSDVNYLEFKKSASVLSFRHRLNPVLFIEKNEAKTTKTGDHLFEEAFRSSRNFESNMNDQLAAEDGTTGFRRPTVSLNESRFKGGLADSGLSPTISQLHDLQTRITFQNMIAGNAMRYGHHAAMLSDYASLKEEKERRMRNYDGSEDSANIYKTNYGIEMSNGNASRTGMVHEISNAGLAGFTARHIDEDASMVNHMSGVTFRTKRLEENEKIIETKTDHLDQFFDNTPILNQRVYLEEVLCNLAGYSMDILNTSASSGSGRTKANPDRTRESIINMLLGLKAFYEDQVGIIFRHCYAHAFTAHVSRRMLEVNFGSFIVEDLYDVYVNIPIHVPQLDFDKSLAYCNLGIIDEYELAISARRDSGFAVDEFLNEKKNMDIIKKRVAEYRKSLLKTENNNNTNGNQKKTTASKSNDTKTKEQQKKPNAEKKTKKQNDDGSKNDLKSKPKATTTMMKSSSKTTAKKDTNGGKK